MHNLHIWQKKKKKKKHTLSPFMYGLVYNPLLKKKYHYSITESFNSWNISNWNYLSTLEGANAKDPILRKLTQKIFINRRKIT